MPLVMFLLYHLGGDILTTNKWAEQIQGEGKEQRNYNSLKSLEVGAGFFGYIRTGHKARVSDERSGI